MDAPGEDEHRWLTMRSRGGVDFRLISRGAKLQHGFARLVLSGPAFPGIARPAGHACLDAGGLGPTFMPCVASTGPLLVADR